MGPAHCTDSDSLFAPPAVQISLSGQAPLLPTYQSVEGGDSEDFTSSLETEMGKSCLEGQELFPYTASLLVSPSSLNCSAQSCGSCSTSPASTEESGQTTVSPPGGVFLRNIFSKGHIPLFPGPVSSRKSFGLISMCMGVFGDH